jgi:predicted TIM-barrel fold metal-dependent hydrolase
MIIDIHTHPVARACVHDPRHRAFFEKTAKCLVETQNGAIKLLLERMDKGGIDRACLMGAMPNDGSTITNEMIRDIVNEHPRRFIGFAGVNPLTESPQALRDGIVRAVKEWGFRGVGELGGVDLLDPRCGVIYETCIELDIPLLVHTGTGLPGILLKYGTPLVIEELANRFPKLTLIAAHAGMPWVLESIAVATRNDNVHIDLSALPAANARLVDVVVNLGMEHGLEDRLLFGSDYPVVDPAHYIDKLKNIGAPALVRRFLSLPRVTSAARRKILGGNAARLLKL